jgi:hypothetical protein
MWKLVRVKKTRQNKHLELRFPIQSEPNALACGLGFREFPTAVQDLRTRPVLLPVSVPSAYMQLRRPDGGHLFRAP